MLHNSVGLAIALALVVASGCASEEESADTAANEAMLTSDDAVPAASAFTLHVSGSPFGTITVEHKNVQGKTVFDTCGTCDLPFLGGTKLTIRVTHPRNTIDCMQFGSWNQAPCAGQDSSCVTTINSDISATVHWIPILGCRPQ